MRYWWAMLLAAILLVVFSVPHESAMGRCVSVKALGYDGQKGVVIPIRFCAVSGHGNVFLSVNHTYGASFQSAVQTAVSVFKNRYFFGDRDILVSVGGPPEVLDGRSVALAIYAGLFSVVFGYDPRNYAFTGDMGPDGSVLPVAFVREKASAFNGRVVVPAANCSSGLICISTVRDVERVLSGESV